MSPGRAPLLVRGPLRARARFGPSKVQGSGHESKNDWSRRLGEEMVAGTADPAEVAGAPCVVLQLATIGRPMGFAAQPEITTILEDRNDECGLSLQIFDPIAGLLFSATDTVKGAATAGGLVGAIFEIVGNGIIALTGGLMIWLGAQRTFARLRR